MFVGRNLKKDWPSTLATAFCRSTPGPKCVLAVRRRRIKKMWSHKRGAAFFTCFATCRFPSCNSYSFSIRHAPSVGEPLTVRCTMYGTPSTAHQLHHAHRYLSGERRRRLLSVWKIAKRTVCRKIC